MGTLDPPLVTHTKIWRKNSKKYIPVLRLLIFCGLSGKIIDCVDIIERGSSVPTLKLHVLSNLLTKIVHVYARQFENSAYFEGKIFKKSEGTSRILSKQVLREGSISPEYFKSRFLTALQKIDCVSITTTI